MHFGGVFRIVVIILSKNPLSIWWVLFCETVESKVTGVRFAAWASCTKNRGIRVGCFVSDSAALLSFEQKVYILLHRSKFLRNQLDKDLQKQFSMRQVRRWERVRVAYWGQNHIVETPAYVAWKGEHLLPIDWRSFLTSNDNCSSLWATRVGGEISKQAWWQQSLG